MDGIDLREALLAATREGPVAGWCDRMAAVAEAAGLDPAAVNWADAPQIVAFRIVGLAERKGRFDELASAVSRRTTP